MYFRDRNRFNEPEEMIPREPDSLYLSEIMGSLSNDLRNTSKNLKLMAENLKRDEKHNDSNLAEKQRKNIQNNFDTVRSGVGIMENARYARYFAQQNFNCIAR